MDSRGKTPIPIRAETLKVLRLMGNYAPILMLGDDAEGYGTRWTIDGQPVQPAIATYLMQSGYIADSGTTELGARKLALTESGAEFRKAGLLWWNGLSLLQKLNILIRG
ncbi:MAG: hypothetical protein M0P95_05220 [Sulfuritalea sp.]|jgi:hypothetical protein|nr:hypothetical protein [Sulfuritalea sp.]